MTGPQAPPGWYPDHSDKGLIRYWDGTTWTEYAAAPENPAAESEPEPTELPSVVSQPGRGGTIAAIVVLIAFLVVGALVYASDESDDPAPPFGVQPADQQAVVELIQAAREEYGDATNDLQRNAALENRDEKICAELGDGRVENWTGQVYEIEDDSEGRGVLGVNIEPNTQVLTRTSAFSDTEERTLIEPGPLLDRITRLETGQVVTFSGQFIADEDDDSCFTNPRFTQANEIEKPLMVFRFDAVSPE